MVMTETVIACIGNALVNLETACTLDGRRRPMRYTMVKEQCIGSVTERMLSDGLVTIIFSYPTIPYNSTLWSHTKT